MYLFYFLSYRVIRVVREQIFFLRTGCGQGTFRAVAREPNDLEKKYCDQNVPLVICNKIGTRDIVSELYPEPWVSS